MVGTQAVSSLFFEIKLTVELFACVALCKVGKFSLFICGKALMRKGCFENSALPMKAFADNQPCQSEVQEIKKPEPQEGETLLRIHKVGFAEVTSMHSAAPFPCNNTQ